MSSRYITKVASKIASKVTSSFLFLILLMSSSYATPQKVLVSIKPLHSLISHITEGINPTELLLKQQQSAHHFQLRPSQKRMINKADIFFYSSDTIESFVPALKNTTEHLQFIQLANTPDITSLSTRSYDSHKHHANDIDGHIWLSIENAQQISRYVTEILSKNNPQHTSHYQRNLDSLLLKLGTLKQNNNNLLSNIKDTPYIVYHDAFQYFEFENKLTGAHFITTSPEHAPGIKRVKELKQLINNQHIRCIFYEPPNIPSLVKTLTDNKLIKLSAIDPAGSQIPAGKQHYFTLMQQTASTLHNCLSQ